MESEITSGIRISSRIDYKRKFSLGEMYRAAVYAPRAISKLIGNKRSKLVDQNFVKRIQLAVTQVNGCAICAYGHAKMALQQGMDNEEINSFLSEGGAGDFIKPEEAKAILFAQHFADSRAFPKKYAYDSVVKEYGEAKAKIILSASQMMIVGNMYGIPLSAFLSRLKGKPYNYSSVFYEFGTLLIAVLFLPIAILHGFIRGLIGLSNERFDKSTDEN